MEDNNNLNETNEVVEETTTVETENNTPEETQENQPKVIVESTSSQEPTNNNKKKTFLIIGIVVVVVLIIACVLVLVLKDKDEPTTPANNNSSNNTSAENKANKGYYGIAIRDLDVIASRRDITDTRYGKVKIEGSTTTVTITPEDETPVTKKFENLNIKEYRLSCDCGNDCSLFYLNNKNEVHEINNLFVEDEKSEDVLITKDVKSIELKALNTDFDTCGSGTLVITNNDGSKNTYHWHELSKYSDNNREFLTMGTIGEEAAEDLSLYAANPSAKIDYFLKDEKGNTLYAKLIVVLNNFKEVYVLGENDNLYHYDNFIDKENGTIYNEKKIKSCADEVDKITLTYEDNTTETIEGAVYKKR